jgi:hypothetical protein
MGYCGASRYHTNPLLELTRGPISQNDSVTLATKYATAYPEPVATKVNEKRQHHDMKVTTAQKRTSCQHLQPILPW